MLSSDAAIGPLDATGPLDAAGFAAATGVSRETLARLEAYVELLGRWNTRINLVGATTLGDLWRRHLLDLAQLAAFVPPGTASLIDLGTGAGLPGLVLAILGVRGVELIEADSRKCAFLHEAARTTGADVVIHACRAAAVPRHPVAIVTARACAPLERLLPLAAPFLGPGTVCLFLKGARVATELTAVERDWKMIATLHPSRSDPGGAVLRLEQVTREPRRN